MSQNILVTGAAGQLGRRVIEHLLARNAGHVIATTRAPEKLADLAARGVEVRHADFDAPASLEKAFAGATRLLLISTDAVDRPGARLAQHRNAVAAAVKAGVKHLVYTSLTNPGPGSAILFAPDHDGTEAAIAESGIGYTILRNNLYVDLLLAQVPRAVATGQLAAATGDGATGYVSREDCARVAAAVLASDFEGKRVIDVTGPGAVSLREVAQLAAEITGKPVEYVVITPAALEAGLEQAGLPAGLARVYASIDVAIAAGTLNVATKAVEDLTGQPAEDVRSFLTRHREALAAAPVH
ncbi:SDR family oxidoreductase [Chondromyces apiculatus]|uniref:NADPH:quinone oxidoreductase 2 n=1 Tax=Chondromyces apiculatus DSM 436 TaxID=1192034 RepID=A0A017T1U0_9BACT|nr:SDR family oxidoreductase [Chondromyces apiculatus]EYF03193.1 NADPH:quinone oxidoreductase 2 [Chondromyces apiculatus DSM 436]